MRTHRTTDTAAIAPLLLRQPVAAAYLIADLDEAYRDVTTWWVAVDREEPVAVLLLYHGDEQPVMLTNGAADGIAAIIGTHSTGLPSQCLAKLPPEHLDPCSVVFLIEDLVTIQAMGRDIGDFVPDPSAHPTSLLGPGDAEALQTFYDNHYPGHYFTPDRLGSGFYAGVVENGVVVAAAGTHAVSRSMGVAVLGDTATAVKRRGQGLTRACVGRLLQELRAAGVRIVALHVDAENAPAIATYRHLGFLEAGHVFQASCTKLVRPRP